MYLYIFDSGENRQSDVAPTEEDLEAIKLGILDIFQLKLDGGFHEILADGSLRPLEKTAVGWNCYTEKEYHYP